jgi:hypothetical protein
MDSSRNPLPPFFATLPVTASDMIRAKLLFAGLVTLAAWLLFALAGLAWAVFAGYSGEMAERLVAAAGSGPAAVAVLVVGFGLAVFVSGWWLVSGWWIGMGGWTALFWVPLAVGFATWVAAYYLVRWALTWPEGTAVLLGLVGVGLAVRTGVVVWVIGRTRQLRLVRDRVLAGTVVAWLATVALAGALMCWLTGGGAALFGCVVLLVPLARLLAMPLALASNRHR